MAKKRNLVDIHSQSKIDFDSVSSALRDERQQCLLDRRFYSILGAQWEGRLGDQFENKPKFEINKIHLSVLRIINEYRNNRIAVDFVSKTGEDDQMATGLDGMLRADEEKSNAQEAYDNAFEEAVGGGFGAWRLCTCYEDEDDDENDYKDIRIEPVNDADSSVYFDLNAKRQDKSDARKCWVINAIPRDCYIDDYDDDPASWPKNVDKTQFDWATPDVVYVAEYYEIEEVPETIRIFRTLDGEEERYPEADIDASPGLLQDLMDTGSEEVGQKNVTRKKVHKYIMSGSKILDDCGYIDGKCIPIVPVYGKRWFVDNIERCMGHVRLAKDAQRIKNMQVSKLGEISALSSVEKPIFAPEQVAGHEIMWADDNVKNFPYLLTNPITDMNGNAQPAGPLAYTKSPQIPPAMAALLQLTEQDMRDLLGNQQAGEEINPNVSGKAIELVQNKLDMQTFIYMSNMSKAMKRSGEIWLSMAKDCYADAGRKKKSLGKENKPEAIELMKPTINKDTGRLEYDNDISRASYDVSVTVGPSSTNKRASTVRALTGLMQMSSDPETQMVLSSMAIMNMEGDGLEDVKAYYRNKLLQIGAVKPTEEEAKQLAAMQQNKQPSPQDQYMIAEAANAQAKAQKAQADTIKVRAETMETIADTEKTKAETAKTMSELDQSERNQTVDTMEKIANIQSKTVPTRPISGAYPGVYGRQ